MKRSRDENSTNQVYRTFIETHGENSIGYVAPGATVFIGDDSTEKDPAKEAAKKRYKADLEAFKAQAMASAFNRFQTNLNNPNVEMNVSFEPGGVAKNTGTINRNVFVVMHDEMDEADAKSTARP